MAEFGDKNPNEYNDDQYLNAELTLFDVIQRMWSAGGDVEQIEESLKTALENVE